MSDAYKKMKHFIENETEFHLGFLPTEQSHSKTATLSQTIADDTAAGIDMLLSVDEDIVPKAREIFTGEEFAGLVDSMTESVCNGGRIFFSGCGATGRLSILLDAIWRRFWQTFAKSHPTLASRFDVTDMENRGVSVMTGGDRALIRSVENFEDFMQFGRRQMTEKNVGPHDTVIAITEGGETSSVIGTAWQGLEAGAAVFMVFNNPADVLAANIARCKDIINEPGVTILDLSSGPMSVAGSTRMQATTSELLVVGAAVELVIVRTLSEKLSDDELAQLHITKTPPEKYADAFGSLVKNLRRPKPVRTLAEITEYEQNIYQADGLITYFANDYLLDILTDTTERAPTFMLPPFRKCDDNISSPSWAFVKNPMLPTKKAWANLLRRSPAGLEWTSDLYSRMSAPEDICKNPPLLDNDEIYKFLIGNEDDASRYNTATSAAVYVLVGNEAVDCLAKNSPFRTSAENLMKKFHKSAAICIGQSAEPDAAADVFNVECPIQPSPVHLWDHLAIKLVLNTISTATMARMGRLFGNWMVYAETTNKKLIDRATRLIQHFTDVDYQQACQTLYETLDFIEAQGDKNKTPLPPTVLAIERIKSSRNKK